MKHSHEWVGDLHCGIILCLLNDYTIQLNATGLSCHEFDKTDSTYQMQFILVILFQPVKKRFKTLYTTKLKADTCAHNQTICQRKHNKGLSLNKWFILA